MSKLFDDVDNDMHNEISNQPYLLQIDINNGEHLPKAGLTSSDPYVIVRFGSNEVARTEVIKWTVNPVWNSSYTIPLLHIQHPLVLEIWDWKSYDKDEILGKVTFDLKDLGSNTLSEDNFVLEQAGRKHASGSLCCGLYLEKRKHMIKISHLPTNTTHSHEIDEIHSTKLSKMLKQEYHNLHILPSIQDALEKSHFLKQKDFNFSHFRDVLHDMHLITTAHDDDDDVDTTSNDNARGTLLPMSLHRIGDNNNSCKNPVKYSKSTRINLSTNTVESYICPYSKYGSHVLVLESESEKEDPVMLVAPTQFMVWKCIRMIRRSVVQYHLQMKASHMRVGITASDLYHKFHVCGPAGGEGEGEGGSANTVFSCTLHVVIERQLVPCVCGIDMTRGLLTCVRAEDGQSVLSRLLLHMKAICVPLDYAECNELLFRFDLLSAKIVLGRANRQSSFNTKSTFEQVKHGLTLISSFSTQIVVNFLDGRELISDSIEGISPFWNTSSTFGVHSKSFPFVDSGAAERDRDRDRPAAIHIHMLTGEKGHETVLGSKLLQFSDLYAAEGVQSMTSGKSNQTTSIGKEAGLKSSFIKLDMNIGLQVDVIKGEDLVPSEKLLNSSFFNPFSDNKEKSLDEMLFDPRIEINCIRYGEDPKLNTYKKYT